MRVGDATRFSPERLRSSATNAKRGSAARAIITLGTTSPFLRDELYCQVMKQLSGNPSLASSQQGWILLHAMVSSFPPSPLLVQYLDTFLLRSHMSGHARVLYATLLRCGALVLDAFRSPLGSPRGAAQGASARKRGPATGAAASLLLGELPVGAIGAMAAPDGRAVAALLRESEAASEAGWGGVGEHRDITDLAGSAVLERPVAASGTGARGPARLPDRAASAAVSRGRKAADTPATPVVAISLLDDGDSVSSGSKPAAQLASADHGSHVEALGTPQMARLHPLLSTAFSSPAPQLSLAGDPPPPSPARGVLVNDMISARLAALSRTPRSSPLRAGV